MYSLCSHAQNWQWQVYYFICLVLILVFAIITVMIQPMYVIGGIVVTSLIVFFSWKPRIGFFLIILLNPLLEWQFSLWSANAPVVDWVGILLLIAIGLRLVYAVFHFRSLPAFPFLFQFLLFWILAAFSFFYTPDVILSVKYLARPIIFFYLIFVLLPILLIQNQRILIHTLWLTYGVGVAAAIMGFISLFLPPNTGFLWKQAQPLPIFNLWPLGYNHNLLAEVLVVAIPFGWYLVRHCTTRFTKKIVLFSTIFMAVINLLTFSRAAWMVLMIELGAMLLWYFRKEKIQLLHWFQLMMIALIPIIMVQYFFHQTYVARSSNASRWLMSEIALSAFVDHPLVGNGLGTFQEFLAQNSVYRVEFGAPLESHGVIQKLLVETGLLGLIGYVFLMVSIFSFLWQRIKLAETDDLSLARITTSVAVLGIFVFELFNTSFFLGKMWLPVGIALAAARLSFRRII